MADCSDEVGPALDEKDSSDSLSRDKPVAEAKLPETTTTDGSSGVRSAPLVAMESGNFTQAQIQGDLEKQELDSVQPLDTKPTTVPRARRRGLLARWTILAEVDDPKKYPRPVKWFITFIVAIAAAAAPLGSAIFFPSLMDVSVELNTTTTITNLSVALYMLSLAIFPLWWSSFSETLGRRTIYITSFIMFAVFSILSAISPNIAMLIVMRILTGGAAGSVQSVGAGSIADIWESKERGQAMGIFYLGPLMGPFLAPIIGGALATRWGWRSTQWFLAIFAAFLLILLIFALPETLKAPAPPPTEPRRSFDGRSSSRSVQSRMKKSTKLLKRFFVDPLKIILYLRYPAVAITIYYASITFGSLYMLQLSLQATFPKPPYNFTTFQVGLVYVPNSIGYIVASVFGGRWTDYIMAREAKNAKRYDKHGNLVYQPEDRMRENTWIAAFMYPSALIIYGWTTQKGVFWAVPLVVNFFYGVGTMLIFSAVTTMLTEFMPKRASSGVALNNFVRNIGSCIGATVTQPLLTEIGNGWLFTGMGVICTASSIVIWAMRHFGPRWRKNMEATME